MSMPSTRMVGEPGNPARRGDGRVGRVDVDEPPADAVTRHGIEHHRVVPRHGWGSRRTTATRRGGPCGYGTRSPFGRRPRIDVARSVVDGAPCRHAARPRCPRTRRWSPPRRSRRPPPGRRVGRSDAPAPTRSLGRRCHPSRPGASVAAPISRSASRRITHGPIRSPSSLAAPGPAGPDLPRLRRDRDRSGHREPRAARRRVPQRVGPRSGARAAVGGDRGDLRARRS